MSSSAAQNQLDQNSLDHSQTQNTIADTQGQTQSSKLSTNSQSFKPSNHTDAQFTPSKGHTLQTNWKFWYFQRFFSQNKDANNQTLSSPEQTQPVPKQNKFQDYREKLKDMGQISTVEQFFQYFVYMKKPSEMPREIDLFFFRENEIPMWEESPNGGIWITKIKKEDNIDKMWETLLLALISMITHQVNLLNIGEQFEEPKVIGLGLSLRTKERLIEIWIKDGRNEKVRTNVSNKLRQFLGLDPDSVTLYYKEHQKSIKDQSTMKNAEGFKFMKADQVDKRSRMNNNSISYTNTNPQHKNWGNNNGNNHHHDSNNHYSNGNGNGAYRKKSNQNGGGNNNQSTQNDKPFSHLGANYHGDDNQRVYRVKAPSHV